MKYRIKLYDGERCYGVEHGQDADSVGDLLRLWSTVATPRESFVVEVES